MIHYQLVCGAEHAFDGWFRNSAGFDAQVANGLVTCPRCATTQVRRALMAPALGRAVSPEIGTAPAPEPPAAVEGKAATTMPDHVRAMLARLRAEVEKSCEYVGPNFAVEARRIHGGHAEVRGIYGETTPDQAEALAEDGIEVARLPWVDRADS